MTELQQKWSKKATAAYAGKTVDLIEYDDTGAPVIVFMDGSLLIAVRDDEGNGPGALYTSDVSLEIIPTVQS